MQWEFTVPVHIHLNYTITGLGILCPLHSSLARDSAWQLNSMKTQQKREASNKKIQSKQHTVGHKGVYRHKSPSVLVY